MAVAALQGDIVSALRQNWRFAAICQFLFTFEEALELGGFQTQRLEAAFKLNQTSYLSWLFALLLRFLTQDKSITETTWDDSLRYQWNLRAKPGQQAPLGTVDEPIPWDDLDIQDKLLCLHELCEWQMEDPERLRRKLTSEDDAVSWRVDPAGWDRNGNTYWLFDDNRLWIQRVPPKRVPKRTKAAPPPKKRKIAKPALPPPRPAGRRSSRLNRGVDNEGWEAVPADILPPPKKETSEKDLFDSDSDLSLPPDEDTDASSSWLEFETICVTKPEWEAFSAKFAASKHPDERQLYKYITKEVLPKVLEVIQAEEKKAALEIAMSNRKRSSRIAMRDSEREQREKEEAEIREQRARAAAALKAERERGARALAEEQARKEREVRVMSRGERLLARERLIQEREEAKRRQSQEPSEPTESWHLRCEVCRADVIDPPESQDVVACEKCGIWQHTGCWDALDRQEGRTPRSWNSVDFQCRSCDDDQKPAVVPLGQPLPVPQARQGNTLKESDDVPPFHPMKETDGSGPTTNRMYQLGMTSAAASASPMVPAPVSLPSPRTGLGTFGGSPMAPPRLPSTPGSSSPQRSQPTSPQHAFSPFQRNMSPRGAFPLRSLHVKSPLSRAVDMTDVPTPMALGPPMTSAPKPSSEAKPATSTEASSTLMNHTV